MPEPTKLRLTFVNTDVLTACMEYHTHYSLTVYYRQLTDSPLHILHRSDIKPEDPGRLWYCVQSGDIGFRDAAEFAENNLDGEMP